MNIFSDKEITVLEVIYVTVGHNATLSYNGEMCVHNGKELGGKVIALDVEPGDQLDIHPGKVTGTLKKDEKG
jgi:hypothetical protein